MAHPSPDPRALRPAPIHAIISPVRRFLRVEAASGLVLLVCSAVALVLANSPLAPAVHHFWDTHLVVGVGVFALDKPLHFWVNDGLMAVFFFVVGLEIKRELVAGELRTVRRAALPVVAAVGGMIAPAGVYLLFGHAGPAARGWGVPMATDIAFVVGVLAAFGRRVPFGLKVFLLSLAIADDMGAVLVIAAAYTDHLNLSALLAAGGGLGLCVLLNKLGVRAVGVYLVVGIAVWVAMVKSEVHPTIAGVLLGLLTPHRPWLGKDTLRLALEDVAGHLEGKRDEEQMTPADVAILQYAAREAVAPLQRLEDRLHPWVGFVVMPVFALANAGVAVDVAAFTHPVCMAVAAGLLVGKPAGIVGFAWLTVRLRWAALPTAVTWRMLVAAGFLGGIGFTMSLFIAELAFRGHPDLLADAKAGVIAGSLLSAAVGGGLLAWGTRKEARG